MCQSDAEPPFKSHKGTITNRLMFSSIEDLSYLLPTRERTYQTDVRKNSEKKIILVPSYTWNVFVHK